LAAFCPNERPPQSGRNGLRAETLSDRSVARNCAIHPGRSIAKRAFDGGPVLVGPGLIDAAWGPCELGNTARRRDCNARCVTASRRQCRERAADELAAAERSIGRITKTLGGRRCRVGCCLRASLSRTVKVGRLKLAALSPLLEGHAVGIVFSANQVSAASAIREDLGVQGLRLLC
jgi:hypothetical protein